MNKKKSNKSVLKTIMGKLHLWGGLGSGIIMFVVAITGCIFVFEEEIRNFTQAEYRFVEPQQGTKASLATLTAVIEKAYPDKKIEQIRVFVDADRAVIAKLLPKNFKEKGKNEQQKDKLKEVISLNPYTASIIGKWNMDKDFLHGVEKMHTSLLLGEPGKWIIKFNIVVFLIMLVSGLVLWFPSKKNQVKNAFKVKFDAKWQRINYDIHNVFGFYFLLPLFLIALTGLWWAVKPVQKGVYALLGDKMEEKEKKLKSKFQAGLNYSPTEAFAQVSAQYPGWNEVHLNYPKNDKDFIRVSLRYPYEVYKKKNDFDFDQYSGKLLRSELYADYSAADKVKHANRDLHTGMAFGLVGKILAFLASLFAASLPITGFLIWYQRSYKKKPVRKPVRATTVQKPALAS